MDTATPPLTQLRRRHPPRTLPWEGPIPRILRPLVRAYLLGYASTVAPRLLTVLLHLFSRGARRYAADASKGSQTGGPRARIAYLLTSVRAILLTGLEFRRFPTFCAVLIGGLTLLQVRPCAVASPQPSSWDWPPKTNTSRRPPSISSWRLGYQEYRGLQDKGGPSASTRASRGPF